MGTVPQDGLPSQHGLRGLRTCEDPLSWASEVMPLLRNDVFASQPRTHKREGGCAIPGEIWPWCPKGLSRRMAALMAALHHSACATHGHRRG